MYFGKTTHNPEKYKGSGTYWLRHLKVHGSKHVETIWYCLFLDKEPLIMTATQFSRQNNIVVSNVWANLIEETGLDGGPHGKQNPFFGKKHSVYSRKLISKNSIGKHEMPESHRRLLIKLNTGKNVTEYTRIKMSLASLGKRKSKSHCDNIRKGLIGKHKSKEHCDKVSKSIIKWHEEMPAETYNSMREKKKAISSESKWVTNGRDESFTRNHLSLISSGWTYGRLTSGGYNVKKMIETTHNNKMNEIKRNLCLSHVDEVLPTITKLANEIPVYKVAKLCGVSDYFINKILKQAIYQ